MRGWLIFVAMLLTAGPSAGQGATAVRPGIDVLLRDSVHLIRGKSVALVTNQAGVDGSGVSDVDRLLQAGIHLVALFSPEHGFRGSAPPGAAIASSRDSATNLPIYSLYGANRAPTDSMLAGIDILLVDLPDVGARYFTYLGTTIEVMRAAARTGRSVLVLDRPNPIGGKVQGNVLDPAWRSFVGSLAMPMRPGMTLGELARLARADLELGTDLKVIPVSGWRREQSQWDTGLPFLPPSPNLPDVESLFHYPGTCLFEGTALSVGRGTDAAFRQIGAPWLDARRVISSLRRSALPGVRLREVSFTPVHPGDGKYSGTRVHGLRLELTDPATYDPTHTAVAVLAALQRIHPDSLGFTPAFDRLAGGPALRNAVRAGAAAASIVESWRAGRERWLLHRQPMLLYP